MKGILKASFVTTTHLCPCVLHDDMFLQTEVLSFGLVVFSQKTAYTNGLSSWIESKAYRCLCIQFLETLQLLFIKQRLALRDHRVGLRRTTRRTMLGSCAICPASSHRCHQFDPDPQWREVQLALDLPRPQESSFL